METVKAASTRESALPSQKISKLCADYVHGFCRRGDKCLKSHEVCKVADEDTNTAKPELWSAPNYLSLKKTHSRVTGRGFDSDGPGHLSNAGARHQNDHVDIHHITIIPTTDEILCPRPPYVPKKDQHHKNHLARGQARLMDTNFRQLRFDSTESIIDICYHASQEMFKSASEPAEMDYSHRSDTLRGHHYSKFKDAQIQELRFSERTGIGLFVTFQCPNSLRGQRIYKSKQLEKGMLVALIGIDDEQTSLSITFMEVSHCESTESTKVYSGNDLRASALLTFANPDDVDSVRRMLDNQQGLLSEKFILVEFPGVLLAGFSFCLKQLQHISAAKDEMAFASMIAPSSAGSSPVPSPPEYSTSDKFAFKCDVLQKSDAFENPSSLVFKPKLIAANDNYQKDFVRNLGLKTTLDDGQANALCDSLSRNLSFTMGPPGTGKTFLGVALAQVLLASRDPSNSKPILVVCMTNHALDAFLKDLHGVGITKLARLGRNTKQDWVLKYQVSELTNAMQRTQAERSKSTQARLQVEGLHNEGISWCEALNHDFISWPAIRGHLKKNYKSSFDSFVGLETVDEAILSDIRLARKAGGFAFEYWCQGGDIKDINQLLDCFNTMLGSNDSSNANESEAASNDRSRERVLAFITRNAEKAGGDHSNRDIWALSLEERENLLKKWKEEVDPYTIVDQTAEIHRRYRAAVARKKKSQQELEARCLAQKDIIGLTTTACAMNWSMLKSIGIETIICEEAGEVMEAQTFCSFFPTVEHAIFIGDPLQLRPQVNNRLLSMETNIGKEYRLDESLFERMMFPHEPNVLPLPTSLLNLQRRMHPDIANSMRATLYPFLQDHDSTRRHPPVAGMVERMWWLDHTRPEDQPDPLSPMSKSYSNAHEVKMAVGLVRYLIKQNMYDLKEIAILTPYNGQLAALKEGLRGTCSVWLSDKDRESLIHEGLLDNEVAKPGSKNELNVSTCLKLGSIDSFQGDEAKIIILSTVRSNSQDRVGFLKTSNRINVACSRARDGFYIIGDSTLMSKVEMWQKIIKNLADKSKVGTNFQTCCSRHPSDIYTVREPKEFEQIPICQVSCNMELPCGHFCKQKCHEPTLHSRMACQEPCQKVLDCGHQCTKTCGEPCGDCAEGLVAIKLCCGHLHSVTCGETEEEQDIVCKAIVASTTLSCGHQLDHRCSTKNQQMAKCQTVCGALLQCGHRCISSCADCKAAESHGRCSGACEKKQKCGHVCAAPCHTDDCPPCQQPCQKTCEHGSCSRQCNLICDPCVRTCSRKCEHQGQCPIMCSLPCGLVPCNKRCDITLPCGHMCPSFCGEQCPEICIQCKTGEFPEKAKMFLSCGHVFDVDEMDAHVGLGNIYQFDDNGTIKRPKFTSSKPNELNINACCPDCGKSCDNLRRYTFLNQLRSMPDTIDRLYAKMGRKMQMFMDGIVHVKEDLQASTDAFQKKLKTSPLSGKTNEQLVKDRGNAIMDVQQKIVNFRDEVVIGFENNMSYMATFIGNSEILPAGNLSFKIRHDSLFYRCRLVTLEESIRMLRILDDMVPTSQHMKTLIQGLRSVTSTQALGNILAIQPSIEECEIRNLKRLEVEMRLLQFGFHMILVILGSTSNINPAICKEKIKNLCGTYPDTAGKFYRSYVALDSSINRGKMLEDINYRETWEFWRKWGKYEIGNIKYCLFGHPYSGKTFSGCPDCGRLVPKAPKVDTAECAKHLHEDAFLEHLKKMQARKVSKDVTMEEWNTWGIDRGELIQESFGEIWNMDWVALIWEAIGKDWSMDRVTAIQENIGEG